MEVLHSTRAFAKYVYSKVVVFLGNNKTVIDFNGKIIVSVMCMNIFVGQNMRLWQSHQQ